MLHTDEVDLTKWLVDYDASTNAPHNKYFIDKETMKMVRYFIARNTALSGFTERLQKVNSVLKNFQTCT